MGLFIGIIYPQTVGYISKRSPTANLGFAVGLYETIFGIGFAVGPITSGTIAQISGPHVAYVVLAVIALLAIPILVFSKGNRTN
jgi:MFS family permease